MDPDLDRQFHDDLQRQLFRLQGRFALSVGFNIVQAGIILWALLVWSTSANGSDPLNEDYRAAASYVTKNHGNVLLLTMYQGTAVQLDPLSAALSLSCHKFCHSDPMLPPGVFSETMIAVDVGRYDPFNKGWRKGISGLTDPRFIGSRESSPAGEFTIGQKISVVNSTLVSEGVYLGVTDNGKIRFRSGGKTWTASKAFIKAASPASAVEVPPWLDLGSAAVRSERIKGNVWVLSAGEFVEKATGPRL